MKPANECSLNHKLSDNEFTAESVIRFKSCENTFFYAFSCKALYNVDFEVLYK